MVGRSAGPAGPKKAIQTRLAEHLHEYLADFVPRVAALTRPVLGNVPVSKDERRRRFWQVEDGWTLERELQLLAGGMTPQDVGLMKFPWRELDAKAGGNADDDRAIVRYVEEMVALGPPEPDPLEQEAQRIEAQNQPAPPEMVPMPPVGAALPGTPQALPTGGPY